MNTVRHILALAEPDAPLGDDCAVVPLAELSPRKGETVAAFVTRSGWDLALMPTVCRIGSRYYGRTEWDKRKIRANDNVLFISRPTGGGGGGQGKAIGAAIAMIALAVLAPYAAGAAIAAAGLTGATATIATSLISTALIAGGSMLLSHFLQPKAATPSDKSPDLYSFAFAGNQARPQQVIPVGYGTRLTYPDFGAPTYSEYDGDAMIDYGLYCVGCGKYQLEELRLSDTVIWTRADGFKTGFTGITLEHVEPGDNVTLFPVNVVTSTEVSGVELSKTWEQNGADSYIGPFAANAAATQATEIIIDFIFPSGLYFPKGTQILGNTVQISVVIFPINDAGAITGSGVEHVETFTASKNSQLRFTKRYSVSPGRYSVRVNRETLAPTSTGAVDTVVWSALRAHIAGPQAFPDVTMLALKARADNGLQTLSGGKMGVVATRILPVYASGSWSNQPTRSIAWAAFDVWTNTVYSAGLPSSGIDLTNLLAYDSFWATAGHTFDHSFTESSSIVEALETVFKAGRAVPAMLGDTLTVMRDENRGLPAMIFTDREIVRGSLSIDYTLYNSALADGVVGSYLDETTWRVSEVSSAPDGTTLANPARVELTGVTKRPQAAGLVRFQAAESTYRRTSVSFQVEAEGRLIRRGMSIAVQSELPQVWGESGEIVSVSGYSLTLDHDLPWSGGAYIEIRAADGSYWGPVAVTQGASAHIAVVNSSDAATVASQTGISFASAVTRSSGQDRPSFVWGLASKQSFRCLVKEGSPSGNYLTIMAVNDDPRVYDVTETGVPPIGDPPGFLNATDPPIITQLAGRTVQDGLAAKLSGGWASAKNALTYEARISFDSAASWTNVYAGTQTSFSAIVNPSDLLLQVRGISPKGIAGAWSQVAVTGITLVVDGSNVDLLVDINNLINEAKAQMELISGLGQGSIAALEKRVFALSEEIANAQATIAGHSYSQRQLIKVTLTQQVTAAFAAIQTETNVRISDTEALAQLITTLTARLGTAEGQISQEATVRATADQALTSLINTLQSRLTNAETNITGQAAAISSLTTTVTNQGSNISSLSTSYTGLNSRLSTAEGTIVGQASAVSTLQSNVTDINGQISTQSTNLTALSSTVNGHTSLLTTYGGSINGLNVQYGVVGTIDGTTGGFIFNGVRKNDGSVSYNVVFSADVIIDGTLTARKIQDLSLTTTKIADNAITTGTYGTGVGSAYCGLSVVPNNSWVLATLTTTDMFRSLYNGDSSRSKFLISWYINGLLTAFSPMGYFTETTTSGATSSLDYFQQSRTFAWQNLYGHDLTSVTLECRIEIISGESPGSIWLGTKACSISATLFKK